MLHSIDYIQVYPKAVFANDHGDSEIEINLGFKNASYIFLLFVAVDIKVVWTLELGCESELSIL